MSISIRQIFPPTAKFTEKNLADQTGKVRKSNPHSQNYHCRPISRSYCILVSSSLPFFFSFLFLALKCYSVLPDPYPKEPEYPDYNSMLTKLMASLGFPCDWRECRHRPRAREDSLRA